MDFVDGCTQTPSEYSKTVEGQIASEVAYDVVDFYTYRRKSGRDVSVYAQKMRDVIGDILSRYGNAFSGMLKRLGETNPESFKGFANVVDEIFSDGLVNWGRVATVYAFGVHLAKYYLHQGEEDLVQEVAKYIGEYVGNHLCIWIQQQGGWEAFVQFFSQPSTENTLWNGLLGTVGIMGVTAVAAAAIRLLR